MSIPSTSKNYFEPSTSSFIPVCSARHQSYIANRCIDGVKKSYSHDKTTIESSRKDLSVPRLYKSPQVAYISPSEAMKIRVKVYRLALEFSFWKSPYPSRAVKLVLAKAHNMTYKQINIWFQNRRDRHKGSSEFNIDQTTTLEQLRDYIQYFLSYPFLLQSKESQSKLLEATSPQRKRITNSTFYLDSPTSMTDDSFLNPQEGKLNKAIDSNLFSFPKPNWLRNPSPKATISEKNSPVALDGLISRFDSCRVNGSSKTAQEPAQQGAEEPTKSSNPFAGRILKNLPRRRLPKHVPVSGDKCEPSRKIRPLPRRASPLTDSSVSEPSDEESLASLLPSSSNESLQDATSRAVSTSNPHSPIEKVLSWRKKNSVSMFNL